MASAASFSSLPSDVVGTVYRMLPDADSKRAFAATCSAVRHAKWLQTSRLTLSHTQLRSTTNPLACLPGVKLRSIIIVGRDTYAHRRGKGGFPRDEGHALLQMLLPEREDIKSTAREASQSLQELQLKGLIFFSEASAAQLGSYLASLPKLSTIRILRPSEPQLGYVSLSQMPASFFVSLSSAPSPAMQLRELEITAQHLSGVHLLAISQLIGLRTFTFVAQDQANLSPLSSLKQLTSLTFLLRLIEDNHEDFAWLAELDHLGTLCALVLAWPLPNVMLEKLPPSLHTLVLEETEGASVLWALADVIRPDRQPSLRCIVIKEMEFDEEDCEPLGSKLSAFLSANPQLTIRTIWMEASENMEGFLTLCAGAPAFARGIEEISLGNGYYLDNAIRLLADVGASPKRLTLADCGIEDLKIVHDGLMRLPSLSRLDIWYMSCLPPPGFGAAVLSVCVRAALVLSAPACEVTVDWCSTNSLHEFTTSLSGNGGEAARDRKKEMATLRGLWELTSRVLPTTCRVQLHTRVGIQDL